MKRIFGFLLLLLLTCGCQQRAEYYEVTFRGNSAAEEELMEVGRGTILFAWLGDGVDVVRMVAGDGELKVFVHTSQPRKLEEALAALRIPEFMSDGVITHLPDGLPEKPEIEMKPNYRLTIEGRTLSDGHH
ncbi:MAG: hypothetical protein PVH19_08090 [Planctomycetia bacterium]|jgi:hypothetical protein